jgi:hypothetical protein
MTVFFPAPSSTHQLATNQWKMLYCRTFKRFYHGYLATVVGSLVDLESNLPSFILYCRQLAAEACKM